MKIKNVSNLTLYLQDLAPAVVLDARRGEDRYLGPGRSVYVPNTSEVMRSVLKGELHKWWIQGIVQLEDIVTLDASGGASPSVTLTHNFGLPPQVFALKQVSATWVDATGTIDIVHAADFNSVTISNATAFSLTFLIRLMV